MPCSKILVMDKGKVVQEGAPYELILQEGKFQELCMAAGLDEFQHLRSLAGVASRAVSRAVSRRPSEENM